jgi:hypothetical protein
MNESRTTDPIHRATILPSLSISIKTPNLTSINRQLTRTDGVWELGASLRSRKRDCLSQPFLCYRRNMWIKDTDLWEQRLFPSRVVCFVSLIRVIVVNSYFLSFSNYYIVVIIIVYRRVVGSGLEGSRLRLS